MEIQAKNKQKSKIDSILKTGTIFDHFFLTFGRFKALIANSLRSKKVVYVFPILHKKVGSTVNSKFAMKKNIKI